MKKFDGGYYTGLFTGMSFSLLWHFDYFADWGWWIAWVAVSILVNLTIRTLVKV